MRKPSKAKAQGQILRTLIEGQLHHPGCDMERCPRCRGQWLGCHCRQEGSFKVGAVAFRILFTDGSAISRGAENAADARRLTQGSPNQFGQPRKIKSVKFAGWTSA